MKKIFLFSTLIVILSFFSTTTSAAVKIKPKLLTTEAIDEIWGKTNFVANLLPVEAQEEIYGKNKTAGRLRFFWGNEQGIDVRMAIVDMPEIMDSQTTSIQIVVNGKQEVLPSLKLSYQVCDRSPKLIDGKIVVRCSAGLSTYKGPHFYIVRNPNGSGYETDVVK